MKEKFIKAVAANPKKFLYGVTFVSVVFGLAIGTKLYLLDKAIG